MKKFKLVVVLALVQATSVLAQTPDDVVFGSKEASVTYADIERYIVENTPPDPVERAAALNRPELYRDMAEMLYTIQILASEAESMPDFDQEQAKWMARIMYQRRIISDYRAKYVKQKLKNVNWEALAKEDYMVNKQSYMTKEKVNASHILIKVGDERGDESAKALAGQLRERLLKGENFAALAKEFSEDPSAAGNAGQLGFFERGQMVEPFENVAFAMQTPGEISDLVKTPFGYHIIEFHAKKPAEQIPFDQVKDKIIAKLQTEMGNKLWEDKLIAIRSSEDIVVDEQKLQQLQKKYRTSSIKK